MIKLSPQREVFAQGIAKGLNQSDAYRVAYPTCLKWADKTLYTKASDLMKDEKVRRRIAELKQPAMDNLNISIERVLRERARLAFFDPRKLLDNTGRPLALDKLDDDTAAAIAGLKVQDKYEKAEEGGEGAASTIVEYKLADKNASLTALEKHLGMYKNDDANVQPLSIHVHLE